MLKLFLSVHVLQKKMKQIIFATGNAGKMKEIREILNGTGWNVLSLKDAGIDAEIEENGTTFEENAKIKAEGIRNWCLENGIPGCSGISAKEIIVLADDSGLEIDWLGGEPGIYSARYMGHETSYREKNANLISRLDAYDTNDAELDEIEQRIDLIYKLKRKYGDTVEDIIAFGKTAREELDRIQFSQERAEHLQAEKHRLYVLARDKAEVLTQTRLRAFEELNRRISGTLDFLNMPGVRMTLRHARGPLASHGQDSVEFYISTNPGEAPKPLAKIASGGELSRITLAIKNAMADKDAVPTVIYDEIDSGVSGKAASRIGEVLKQSAQDHQILCITHTAQIAALADCHLLIQKNVANERTYTEIHPLDQEGRVDALAHIISGDHVTELSRANAREMLGLAESETRD